MFRPPAAGDALDRIFYPEMISADQREHAGQRIDEAFDGRGHGRLEDRPRGVRDGGIEIAQENKRTIPKRSVLDGRLRGLQRIDPGDGGGHHSAEFGHGGIGVRAGLVDQPVEREAGLRGGLLKLLQLAARFVEMPAEPLQVLLHELRHLGENHRADHTQRAVQQAFHGAQQSSSGVHATKMVVMEDNASWR